MRLHFWLILAGTAIFLWSVEPWQLPRLEPTRIEFETRNLSKLIYGLIQELCVYLAFVALVLAHRICWGERPARRSNSTTPAD